MTAARPQPPSNTADALLRQRLRDALEHAPADDLQALQQRTLEQWQLRAQASGNAGPLAVLRLGWRQHPLLFKSALLALVLAGVLWIKFWAPADGDIDELLQPDVLSLMTMGVL